MKSITNNKSGIIDQLQERPTPYYNHFLHLEGYKPHEILWAEDSPKDRKILKDHLRNHRKQ